MRGDLSRNGNIRQLNPCGQKPPGRERMAASSIIQPSPMRAKFLILLLALACRAVHAGEWTICVDSNDWGVYTHPDHDGSLQTLVRSAAEDLGTTVHYVAYPWRRCELMAEKGEVDGL